MKKEGSSNKRNTCHVVVNVESLVLETGETVCKPANWVSGPQMARLKKNQAENRKKFSLNDAIGRTGGIRLNIFICFVKLIFLN